MEEQSLRKYLDQKDYRSSCKRFCDDIEQRLDKVTSSMADRAIWELFQNAGDVAQDSPSGKKAHIRMTLTPDEFIFAHKGKPFTFDTLMSLVKQVSSESKETDEDATGQYGTGFVTTHSFGKVIYIYSSLEQPLVTGKYIDIDKFELNRLYSNRTEFYDTMANQMAEVKELAMSSDVTDAPREWTELHYQLNTAIGGNGHEKARRALTAAVKTLPFLMTINPRICDVEIVNQIDSDAIRFQATNCEDEDGLKVMQITVEHNGNLTYEKIYYLATENNEDVVILPLASPTTARSLDGMAKLFVNYPLLGTEDFGFEFIFHSRGFIPEEERNGLFLPKQDANSPHKYEANVKVLNRLSDMLFRTLENMQMTISNWEEILRLNLDAPIGSDTLLTDFYHDFKQKWVNFYKSLNVVDVEGERRSVASDKVRVFSQGVVGTLAGENIKFTDAVYEGAQSIGKLPAKDLILSWSNVIATWLPSDASCFITVEQLAEKLSQGSFDVLTVLEFDKYLAATGHRNLFDNYTLIPNQSGQWLKKNQLRDASNIPEWLVSMVSKFIPAEVAKFVDCRFLLLDSFAGYSRKELRDALNGALDECAKNTFRKNVNPHCADQETLKALAGISLVGKSSSDNTQRMSTMKVVCGYIGIPYEIKVLAPLDPEEVEIAKIPFKHLVENLLLEISSQSREWVMEHKDYIYSLHLSLSTWSEYYNCNDRKGLAMNYACFPNRLNEPVLARKLRSGVGITERLFEFYKKVIGKELDGSLLAAGFEGFCEFETVDGPGIAKEIEDALAEKSFESDVVLDIIEYLDADKEECAYRAKLFPRISEKKANLFLKQVKPECKEGVFRLMKVDDADKLNQLADLAEECDMDSILRLGRQAIRQRQNEQADFEYKKALGEYVEDMVLDQLKNRLQSSLNDTNIRVEVGNVQCGQDLMVLCNDTPVYYIEIKSRWGVNQSVEMSPLQLKTCVQEADHYALCCVNMSGISQKDVEEHVYPEVEKTLEHLSALTNIGQLAKDAYNASAWQEDTIHIGGGYSCIVPQPVIKREGHSFNNLIEVITAECIAKANSQIG